MKFLRNLFRFELSPAFTSDEIKLLKAWRRGAAFALPIAFLAFVAAIYFEYQSSTPQLFDFIFLYPIAGFILLSYIVMWFRLSLFRIFVMILVSTNCIWHLSKLLYSLYLGDSNALIELAANLTWAPIVTIVAFFGPKMRLVTRSAIFYAAIMAVIPVFYWLPNLVTGTNVDTVQGVFHITLGMLFVICIIVSLAAVNRHILTIETHAKSVEQLAYSDELTGLLNKRALEQKVQALPTAHKPYMLGLVKLGNFVSLDGPVRGDAILIQIANRIHAAFTENVSRGHLERGEFAVLATYDESGEIKKMGKRILEIFDQPIFLDDSEQNLTLTPFVGFSLYPDHGTDFATLYTKAQRSLQLVQQKNQAGFAVAETIVSRQQLLLTELQLLTLHKLPQNALRIRYESIVNLETNQVVGLEASTTWQTEHGWLPLQLFRKDLENIGEIAKVERSLLEHICFEACRSSVPAVSIEVSPGHFLQGDFVPSIRKTLSQVGLSPARLILEVDAYVVRLNPELCVQVTHELTRADIRVVLKEFGTSFVPTDDLSRLQLQGVKLAPNLLNRAKRVRPKSETLIE